MDHSGGPFDAADHRAGLHDRRGAVDRL